LAARPALPADAGSTRTLPLAALGSTRVGGAPAEEGLPARAVRPFSLLGVTWDDSGADLGGPVQVRTRAAATGAWSGWQDIEAHTDDVPDPGSADQTGGQVRGATAPLWVGDSDGVQVRVGRSAGSALPPGLRLEMVDPGDDPPDEPDIALEETRREEGPAANPVAAGRSPDAGKGVIAAAPADAHQYSADRPRIITRAGWGANERLRHGRKIYTGGIKAVFVHHTATGNGYTCAQAPSIIRGIYRYHARSRGWRDLGYNFLVDKCGNIYEGRAGGVSRAVYGAHTLGFNSHTMGIAVLGNYRKAEPSEEALEAVAELAAWKLGLYGADPAGTTYLKSGGGNRYKKGKKVRFNVISGHRDGYATSCPGAKLYDALGSARSYAVDLQGR
jgi:uncharacterized protein with LGFP repeats